MDCGSEAAMTRIEIVCDELRITLVSGKSAG